MENVPDLLPIFDSITGIELINWFFKAFAVLLSFMFLLYAVIIYRQTQVMNKTVARKSGPLLSFISLVQIFLAIMLIYLSIFFI